MITVQLCKLIHGTCNSFATEPGVQYYYCHISNSIPGGWKPITLEQATIASTREKWSWCIRWYVATGDALEIKKHWDALEIKEAPSVLKQWRHNWGSLHLTHQHLQLYMSNYLSPIYVHTIACPSLKNPLLYTSVGRNWLAALGSHQVSTYTQVTLFLFPNTIILWVVLMMDRVHVQSFKEIRLKNRVYTPSQPYYDDGEHVELLPLALINFSDVCCVYQWPFVM